LSFSHRRSGLSFEFRPMVNRALLCVIHLTFGGVLVAGPALLTASCSANPDLIRHKVATHDAAGGGTFLGRLQGQLGGQLNQDGTACLWVQNAGTKTLLIWPNGFYVTAKPPLKIADARGTILATVGQQLSVAGGMGPDPKEEPVFGCNGGSQSFLVGEVVQPGS